MAKKSDARRITLKFDGKCKACGTALPKGSKALWYPGGTVYGLEGCHQSPFAQHNSKPKTTPPKAAAPTKSVPKGPGVSLEELSKQFAHLIQMLQKVSK
jgi:hypothetical protein